MESPPFIPSPPRSTSSDRSYFTPQTITDMVYNPVPCPPRVSQTSPSHRYLYCPVKMSYDGSINLSNISPAESASPLPIPHPTTPAVPAMSPCTTKNTLDANADIDTALLRNIANGLLTTIANWETDMAIQYQRFQDQISGLQERILQYEETFKRAPEGYTLNDGRIPHFRIPCSHGLSRPAKWIKLNDDGTASGFADTDGPKLMPHITNLYTQPDDQYNEEGEAKPALPLLPWFRFLMVGPSVDFALLHNALVDHDDWGLTHKVHHYRELDREFSDACVKLEQMQVDLNAISQARAASETHLLLARASEQVDKLENVPWKTQAMRSAWKRKSNGRGRPV